MRTWFRNLLLVGAVCLVPLVSGCTSDPDFMPPIRWKSDPHDVQRSVQLNADGSGTVMNMPFGSAIEDETDGYCIQDTDERYSGPITWKAVTKYNFEISFGDSNYVISDGPGKLGSQDWSEIRIPACGDKPEYWPMYAVCGKTGLKNYDEGLPTCG